MELTPEKITDCQYGLCWIFDNVENIPKKELERLKYIDHILDLLGALNEPVYDEMVKYVIENAPNSETVQDIVQTTNVHDILQDLEELKDSLVEIYTQIERIGYKDRV